MFIELPNEIRVNTDHISTYYIKYNERKNIPILRIDLEDGNFESIPFDIEEDAKLALYALDRAIGVKPLIIRK